LQRNLPGYFRGLGELLRFHGFVWRRCPRHCRRSDSIQRPAPYSPPSMGTNQAVLYLTNQSGSATVTQTVWMAF
jgi:hypothetical protein